MNILINQLEELGVVSQERLEVYYPRVRDRDDIKVLRDKLTEVILLSSSNHVNDSYYEKRKEKSSHNVHGVEVTSPRLEDNIRRKKAFGIHIRNKQWMDFGCGLGGMLDELANDASYAVGLEPNRDRANLVAAKGHNVVQSLDDINDSSLDVVTLFHVLEHLLEPIEILRQVKRILKPNGKVIIEVPHAKDVLFSLYDCDGFKKFTFWSEHLLLHTRLSLRTVLRSAGFNSVEISGYQRYPLSNHLHWLAMGCGGGHEKWSFLNSENLLHSYAENLAMIDRNDTLISICN